MHSLIVAGGREVRFPRSDDLVAEAFDELPWRDDVTEIIHGGAKGIDAAAGRYFSGWKPISVVHANWELYGKCAGPIRNKTMAAMGNSLLAIWDGKSKGTANMIKCARDAGIPVHVYRYTNDAS